MALQTAKFYLKNLQKILERQTIAELQQEAISSKIKTRKQL
jgi:hypothetical protein